MLSFILRTAAFLAFAGLMVSSAGSAPPVPDSVNGSYTGKVKSRSFAINNTEQGTHIDIVHAVASQSGEDMTLDLYFNDDGEEFVIQYQGRVGRGVFWAAAELEDEEGNTITLITGTVSGSTGKVKLKGKGAFGSPGHYSTVSVALKSAKP